MSETAKEQPAPLAQTELEEKLRGPEGEAVRDALLQRFDRLAKEIEERTRSGVSPEDFARAEHVRKAIAAAREVALFLRPRHSL